MPIKGPPARATCHSEPQRIAGRNIGRVWGFRDVTADRKFQQQLAAERHLLHQLMDNLPDHIYFKDRLGHFTLVNRAHITGFGCNEATAAIREMERATGFHHLIIAMTAYALKGDEDRCLRAGMDGYLAKPIERGRLQDVLARLESELASSPK